MSHHVTKVFFWWWHCSSIRKAMLLFFPSVDRAAVFPIMVTPIGEIGSGYLLVLLYYSSPVLISYTRHHCLMDFPLLHHIWPFSQRVRFTLDDTTVPYYSKSPFLCMLWAHYLLAIQGMTGWQTLVQIYRQTWSFGTSFAFTNLVFDIDNFEFKIQFTSRNCWFAH